MIRLSFDVFGYRVVGITINFDLPDSEPLLDSVVTKAVKGMSRAWFKGLVR